MSHKYGLRNVNKYVCVWVCKSEQNLRSCSTPLQLVAMMHLIMNMVPWIKGTSSLVKLSCCHYAGSSALVALWFFRRSKKFSVIQKTFPDSSLQFPACGAALMLLLFRGNLWSDWTGMKSLNESQNPEETSKEEAAVRLKVGFMDRPVSVEVGSGWICLLCLWQRVDPTTVTWEGLTDSFTALYERSGCRSLCWETFPGNISQPCQLTWRHNNNNSGLKKVLTVLNWVQTGRTAAAAKEPGYKIS